MKKILYYLLTASLLISCLAACSIKSTDSDSTIDTAVTEETAVNIYDLQDKYNQLKSDYDSIAKIYDDTLESSINTYCEKYLSYSGSATDNIDSIKDVITNSYYNELMSQTGHQKYDDDYEQATGLYKIFYENYSSPSDNIEVISLCKQTVILDDKVTTEDAVYIFEMLYENNKWIINGMSAV